MLVEDWILVECQCGRAVHLELFMVAASFPMRLPSNRASQMVWLAVVVAAAYSAS